jgi:hypothetical protein
MTFSSNLTGGVIVGWTEDDDDVDSKLYCVRKFCTPSGSSTNVARSYIPTLSRKLLGGGAVQTGGENVGDGLQIS